MKTLLKTLLGQQEEDSSIFPIDPIDFMDDMEVIESDLIDMSVIDDF